MTPSRRTRARANVVGSPPPVVSVGAGNEQGVDETPVTDLEQEYEIIGELGRGGSAVVYHGRDRDLGRDVAIKVVRPRFAIGDVEALQRLAREARTVAQLEHPNIVRVHAVKRLPDGGLALVMQYIPGKTLKQAIVEDGPFAAGRAEQVIRDIAAALAYANAKGVVHRDVKPENVFLDAATGRAMLSDFGIAHSSEFESRLTMTGTAIGTPAYMAPEQIDGATASARSDLYSLGLVAWEMLTGRRPWEGESLYSIIYKQKHDHLPPIDQYNANIPLRLQYIVERMLQKKPAARWAGADGLLAHLDASVLPADWTQWQEAHRRRTLRKNTPRAKAAAVVSAALATIRFQRPSGGVEEGVPPTPVETSDAGDAADDAAPTWVEEASEVHSRLSVPLLAAVALLVVAGSAWALYSTREADEILTVAPVPILRDVGVVEVPVTVPSQMDSIARDSLPATLGADSSPLDTALTPTRNPAFMSPIGSAVVHAIPVGRRGATGSEDNAVADSADRTTAPTVTASPPVSAPRTVNAVRATTDRALIAAGGRHTCVVLQGRTHCWGGNDEGQLGDGQDETRAVPVQVAGEIEFSQVAAGIGHSCALTRGGETFCWGDGNRGQLGDATTTSRNAPVRVAGNLTFATIAAGRAHTCALTFGGDAYCWGSNTHGQLGDGSTSSRSTPVRVASDAAFIAIAAGWTHTCGITTAGAALCWGDNSAGQAGGSDRSPRRFAQPVPGNERFTSIAAGSAHTCAIATDGAAWCWGRNSAGQLGTGNVIDRDTPTRVETSVRFASISAGSVHSCARTTAGSVYCWGRNSYGQLGDGTTMDRARPVRIAGAIAFTSVNATGAHTCGVSTSGDALCWGYNVDGQLGDGTRNHRSRPTRVTPPQ